jgi:hypothetical protein
MLAWSVSNGNSERQSGGGTDFAGLYHTAGMIIAEDTSPSQLVATAVEVASMKEI